MKVNFYKDLNEGKKAEEIVVEVLCNNGYMVEDVRLLKPYQARSIDFVAIGEQDVRTIEVKDDTKGAESQNFIIEMEAGDGKPGWFRKCHATSLFIVSRAEHKIFSIPVKELKAFMDKYETSLREVFIRDYNEDGTAEVFKCRLVAREYLKKFCNIKEICY